MPTPLPALSFFRHKRRWYWAAQLLLWASFALALLSHYLMLHPGFGRVSNAQAERVLVWIVALALAGLLLTHLVRLGLIRSGLLHAGLGRQLLALLLLKVGLSTAYFGVVAGLVQVLTPPAPLCSLPTASELALAARPEGSSSSGFMRGLKIGFQASTIDNRLNQGAWSHYTLVWLLGYLLIAVAERRLGAELQQARAEADLSRAELELLHQQINPHFLFNTLNSIRALALTDTARTRTALTQLADLLRYSLRPPGSGQLIPLGEELAAVRDYLALEQTRFGPERLQVCCQVPAELLGWPVPAAALLTLVENAVKHGISATPAGGLLQVQAEQHGPSLTLAVSQPGHLIGVGGAAGPGAGLGLANTRQRLRALYGEAASLTLHENPGGTVVARLGVPVAPLP